jgi:hypothetical protein
VARAIHGNDDVAAVATFCTDVAAYVLHIIVLSTNLHFIVIIGESEAGSNMPRTAKPLQVGRSQLLFTNVVNSQFNQVQAFN